MEVGNKVSKGHLSAQQKGDWSGEETDGYEEGTKELQNARKLKQLEQARPVRWPRKIGQLFKVYSTD